MSRFVATPFVESNTQTVKVKQVQDQLKHIETRALDQTQDQQGLISKEISQPSPSGHPPATASGLLFYFHFFPSFFFIIFDQQHRISYGTVAMYMSVLVNKTVTMFPANITLRYKNEKENISVCILQSIEHDVCDHYFVNLYVVGGSP